MTDQLVQQLTRELGLRATDMTSDPALAARVVQRAGVVRRRRTFGVSVVAAVAVAAVVFVTTGPALRQGSGPTPPPATRTTVDRSRPAPPAGPPTIGYVVNGGPSQDHLTTRTVVHLGGRSIALPKGWWVQRVNPSGAGLLLDAALPDGGLRSVYVQPDGSVQERPALAPGPMAMDRDGSVMLDTLEVQLNGRLKLVDVATGNVTGIFPGPALKDVIPIGTIGPRSVVVGGSANTAFVWTAPATGNGPVTSTPLPGPKVVSRVTDTDVNGTAIYSSPDGMTLVHANGAAGWTYVSMTPDRIQYGPEFSADGSLVAAVTDNRLLFVSSSTGARGVETDLLPAATSYAGLYWEDARTVLVDLRANSEQPQTVSLVRCSTISLKCTPLTPKGYLVLPST
jgi:hypothetical protein